MRRTPIVGSILLYPPFLAHSVRAKKRTRHKRERATAKIWQTPVLVFVFNLLFIFGFFSFKVRPFCINRGGPTATVRRKKKRGKRQRKRTRKRKKGVESGSREGKKKKEEERRKKREKREKRRTKKAER